nr:MAG TPA: hypothetical protein [Caudoviricetes sp.]
MRLISHYRHLMTIGLSKWFRLYLRVKRIKIRVGVHIGHPFVLCLCCKCLSFVGNNFNILIVYIKARKYIFYIVLTFIIYIHRVKVVSL